MHTPEEVRELAAAWSEDDHKLHGMLLSYAALLEAMEEADTHPTDCLGTIGELRHHAAEILEATQ